MDAASYESFLETLYHEVSSGDGKSVNPASSHVTAEASARASTSLMASLLNDPCPAHPSATMKQLGEAIPGDVAVMIELKEAWKNVVKLPTSYEEMKFIQVGGKAALRMSVGSEEHSEADNFENHPLGRALIFLMKTWKHPNPKERDTPREYFRLFMARKDKLAKGGGLLEQVEAIYV